MSFRKAVDLLLLFIPAILGFVGQAATVAKWLIEHIDWLCGQDVDVLKDWSLGVGTLLSGLLVAFRMLKLETQHESDKKTLDDTLKLWQEVLTGFLQLSMRDNNFFINIRILRPKNWYEKRTIAEWRGERIEFRVVHLSSLAADSTPGGLCFEMWPNPQGVAGTAYKLQKSQYDPDVQVSPAGYNLTPYQQQALSNVRFVLCVPIMDEANKVRYVVSIDSASRLKSSNLSREQKTIKAVINYLTLAKKLIPVLARQH